jgi:hypothetical protein
MTCAVKDTERKPTQEEMQQMLENIDLQSFWQKVTVKVSANADEYERARAKSREGAANQVLL